MTHSARLIPALVLFGLAGSALATPPSVNHVTACIDGVAAGYACSNVDLAAQVSLAELGASAGQDGNDLWGWTDPLTGREYALMGVGNGMAFVDVTTADHPVVLGLLPTHSGNSLWRDVKVYQNHAYIVSEATSHGMQVFDLTRLRNVIAPPVVFSSDGHYAGFGRAHNIVINEQTGFAYAVGSVQGTTQCAGGLHMLNLANPLVPQFAGCFSADGYTHDAQCVIYDGPDADYVGHEICFNANEDTLTIVDVSDKGAPVQISRVGYVGVSYAHQGWLTPGQRWFLLDDEIDELDNGHNTRTYVWDLLDLDDPKQTFAYTASVASSDHNLYIRDQYAYLANYRSGLRILDLSGIEQGDVREVAHFDTHPASNASGFDGAWSSYPYFASGTVIVSDISRGLFVLQPILCQEPASATGLGANAAGDNAIAIAWNDAGLPGATYEVHRELGGCAAGPGSLLAEGLGSANFLDSTASADVEYGYRVRVVAEGGQCRSGFSDCVSASTTGVCNAPPQFAGLASATTPGDTRCTVELAWPAATSSCAGSVRYELHRSTDAGFVPAPGNRIRSDLHALDARDFDLASGNTYHYVARARDVGNAVADDNLVRRSVTPLGELSVGVWSNGAEVGESFLGAGTVTPQHVAWHTTDEVVHSGERAYLSGYVDSSCVALTTPPIDLGQAGNSQLDFFQRFGIESGWDGGRVEISTDGSNWTPIAPTGGYPQQISNSGNACNWPVGTPVYAGTALSWQAQSFDLSSYAGTVQLRWVLGTDTAVSEEGWWLDTLTVSPAQVSGSCVSIPWLTSLAITAHEPTTSTAGSLVEVQFALELDPDEGNPPTGSVLVSADAGVATCTAQLPESSCALLLTEPGLRTLSAAYSGDGAFPAAGDSVTHEVLKAEVSLEISANSGDLLPDGVSEVTASLAGVAKLASPSGTIQVRSDLETEGCSIVLPATSCQLVLRAATHTLTASYSGDAYYQPQAGQVVHAVVLATELFGSSFE